MTQPGSAVHQKTSSGCRSSASGRWRGGRRRPRARGSRPWAAGGAAGEVQQRHVLRGRSARSRTTPMRLAKQRRDRAVSGGGLVRARPAARASGSRSSAATADLAAVERRGRHEHAGLADRHARCGSARARRPRTAARTRCRSSTCRAPRRTARGSARAARTRGRPCDAALRSTLAKRLVSAPSRRR